MKVCFTGEHQATVKQMIPEFRLPVDFDLKLMKTIRFCPVGYPDFIMDVVSGYLSEPGTQKKKIDRIVNSLLALGEAGKPACLIMAVNFLSLA